MLSWCLIWLGCINTACFIAFAVDKRRAIERGWRIQERDLLLLCFVGGTAGAYWARHLYQHKTRKQPFSMLLHLTAAIQAGLAVGLLA